MPPSHHVTLEEIEGLEPVILASATTTDELQRKRLLGYVGRSQYGVLCRRLDSSVWRVIYTGPNLVDAVQAYNNLS